MHHSNRIKSTSVNEIAVKNSIDTPILPSNPIIKHKIQQVMESTKVNRDEASIALYQHKDNINDSVLHLINSIHPSTNSTPFTPNDTIKAVLDSGASSHFVREEDEPYVLNVTPHNGPTVTLPDATKIQSTKPSVLPLSSDLTLKAQTGNILPDLKSSTLVSAGQLCDDNCDIVFRKEQVHVLKNNKAMDNFLKTQHSLLDGNRNHINKLWNVSLPRVKTTIQANNCHLPTSHPSIYPASMSTTPSHTCAPKSSSTSKHFCHNTPFFPMESLIADNDFDYVN